MGGDSATVKRPLPENRGEERGNKTKQNLNFGMLLVKNSGRFKERGMDPQCIWVKCWAMGQSEPG